MSLSTQWRTNCVAVLFAAVLYSLGSNILTVHLTGGFQGWHTGFVAMAGGLDRATGETLPFWTAAMSWKALGVNLVVGYIVGCVIGIFLPLINWGMALAKFFGFTFQKPKRFHKAVQVFYTFFFALFVSFLMTMFAEVLMGGQSFVVGLQDWGKGFLLYFVDALIVTLVFLDFFEWASRKLQHFPDPPWAAKGGQANHGGGGGGH